MNSLKVKDLDALESFYTKKHEEFFCIKKQGETFLSFQKSFQTGYVDLSLRGGAIILYKTVIVFYGSILCYKTRFNSFLKKYA